MQSQKNKEFKLDNISEDETCCIRFSEISRTQASLSVCEVAESTKVLVLDAI